MLTSRWLSLKAKPRAWLRRKLIPFIRSTLMRQSNLKSGKWSWTCFTSATISSNGIKIASARFQETIVTTLVRRGAADHVSSEGSERWSKSKDSWAVVKSELYLTHCSYSRWPGSSSSMWTKRVAIVSCRNFTLKRGKWKKWAHRCPEVGRSRKLLRSSKMRWVAVAPNIEGVRIKKVHWEGLDHRKDWSRVGLADNGDDYLGIEIGSPTEAAVLKARHHLSHPTLSKTQKSLQWRNQTRTIRKCGPLW